MHRQSSKTSCPPIARNGKPDPLGLFSFLGKGWIYKLAMRNLWENEDEGVILLLASVSYYEDQNRTRL